MCVWLSLSGGAQGVQWQNLSLPKFPANWSRHENRGVLSYSNTNLLGQEALTVTFYPAVVNNARPPQLFTQTWQKVKPATDTLMTPRMRRLYTYDGVAVMATQAAAHKAPGALSVMYLYIREKDALPVIITAPDAKSWKQLQSSWDEIMLDSKWK